MALFQPADKLYFLEIHCTLIDLQERTLDIKELTKKCEGYTSFGKWQPITVASNPPKCQSECKAMWMLCFSGQYSNIFAELKLKWRLQDEPGAAKEFKTTHPQVFDKQAADIYRKMVK